ncbi:alpha-latrocrustotoxin-Lt1a-like [Argonauta hians]
MALLNDLLAVVKVFYEALEARDVALVDAVITYCRDNHCTYCLQLDRALCMVCRQRAEPTTNDATTTTTNTSSTNATISTTTTAATAAAAAVTAATAAEDLPTLSVTPSQNPANPNHPPEGAGLPNPNPVSNPDLDPNINPNPDPYADPYADPNPNPNPSLADPDVPPVTAGLPDPDPGGSSPLDLTNPTELGTTTNTTNTTTTTNTNNTAANDANNTTTTTSTTSSTTSSFSPSSSSPPPRSEVTRDSWGRPAGPPAAHVVLALAEKILHGSRPAPGPCVTYADETGRTAVHHAVWGGSLDLVEMLVSAAGSPVLNRRDSEGRTPLLLACQRGGSPDLVRYLAARCPHHVNLSRGHDDERALHVACGAGHLDVVKILVEEAGANVEVLTLLPRGGVTPLHKAVRGGHPEVVRYLCDVGGANPEASDADNKRPIHMAVEAESDEILQALVDRGVDVNATDRAGQTPLHLAVKARSLPMVRTLLQTGRADLNLADRRGDYPLHLAVTRKSQEITAALVQAGCNVHVVSPYQETALLQAAAIGCYVIVDILLQQGANVNAQGNDRSTALHKIQYARCSREESDRIISRLLEFGAYINCQDSRGFTPLHSTACTCVMGHVPISTLRILVGAGAKVSHHSPNRNSPLCWLVWNGCFEAAQFLVQAGWNLNKEAWIDLPGKTAEQTRFHDWLKDMRSSPWTLSCLCRQYIRNYLLALRCDREILSCVKKLPIPVRLKEFLTYSSSGGMAMTTTTTTR